ncbi:MAG: ABC transporter ATP-binding protein/permease [Anaerolineae bacterium]|jgi:ATP-binding cassette subfamily B protein|nr:ABC transporter ATP-binding protein/permease [Anaerolineae bacterium]
MGSGHRAWGAVLRQDDEAARPKISRALVVRVVRYARRYWGTVGLLMVAITISSLLDLVPPLLYRHLVDDVLPSKDPAGLNWLAVGLIGVPILGRLIGIWQSYLSARAGEGIIRDLRESLYRHLQAMSLRFYTHTKTGELMSRLNNDVSGAQQAVTGTLVNLVSNVVSLVSTLVVMISLDLRLTVIGVAILPLLILPARSVAKRLRTITRGYMEANAKMNALMNETLNVSGALLVKIFGRTEDENSRFTERATEVRDLSVRRSMVARWFYAGLGLTSALGTAFVFWAGGHYVLRDAMTVGTIIAFSSYLRQIYQPLTALAGAQVEFATSLVSFERVFEVLDLPVEIDDRPSAVELTQPQGWVQFDRVWFRYRGDGDAPQLGAVRRYGGRGGQPVEVTKSGALADDVGIPRAEGEGQDDEELRWVLEDVSFDIRPGQLAALVGPSGAGKTTITYLLPRLYDPSEGRILLDGRDLREIRLGSLSSAIGMVTQETYLFHDTLRANLLYARPEATDEQLVVACKAANIHSLVLSLPNGYDTVVGERGYRLSGGEKQRVALARVILKDPRVLILDEATSHLDSESEALIQEALERIMKGRTSLVIAHRLSTVLSADVILVLEQGRIVQRGRHDELLAEGGLYRQLFERQFAAAKRGQPGAVRDAGRAPTG